MALTANSKVCANLSNPAAAVQGEVVILEMTAGKYFGLNKVGARIWQLIQSPIEVSELVEQITREYDVGPERFGADLAEFMDHLEAANLVKFT